MKWVKTVYRDLSVLFDSMVVIANRDYLKEVLDVDMSFRFRRNENREVFMLEEELEEFSRKIRAKNKTFLYKVAANCFSQCERLILVSKHIAEEFDNYRNNLEYSKSYGFDSNYVDYVNQLLIYFNNYVEEHLKILVYLFAIPFAIEKIVEKDLKKFQGKYYNIITSPSRISYSACEIRDLLNLALDIKKYKLPKKIIERQLHRHTKKYCWLGTRHFKGELWTVDFFRERLIKLIKNLKNKKDNSKMDFQKAIIKLKVDDKDLKKINLFRDFVYLRTLRKDAMTLSSYHVRPFFEAIAKELNVDYHGLVSLTVEEIPLLLQKKIDVENRKNGFNSVFENGILKYSINKQAYILGQVNKAQVNGMVAYGGSVIGKAIIVLSRNDIYKVSEGDILITTMSTPDYIIALEKCSAIVTDEGGITCHAAIISRELKKPCVIGTKIATRVFKDGDEVEVNANNGVVRKL